MTDHAELISWLRLFARGLRISDNPTHGNDEGLNLAADALSALVAENASLQSALYTKQRDLDGCLEASKDIQARNFTLVAERDALRGGLERVLLDVEFMWQDGTLPDRRDDIIYVAARAALERQP